jgi:dolichyl-phosphate beta-glucosyltransferase
MTQYSIVIGALNEAKRLPKTLDRLLEFLDQNDLSSSTEIVIVAAKGRDDTAEVAKKKLRKYPKYQVLEPKYPIGKGRDIQLGMLSATGSVRLYMDADLATPLRHTLDAFKILDNKDADIVIGTRDITRMHTNTSRRAVSILGNICFAIISGYYLPDTQCGFKAFTAKSAKVCFTRMTRMQWSFDMEILLIGKMHGYSVAQLPIADWKDVAGGTFSSSFKQTLVFGKDLLILYVNRLTGRYTR